MERKLSMLTWDAIPKGQNLPTSTVGSGTICDDMASDASSDLFEIENISGSMYPVQLTAGIAADDMSICMSPASQYAPSEASIQWSVVTASAADYSSVLSDYNDETSVSFMATRHQESMRR
ncbi:UNVERIFIED_CONTAM: protein PHYTOCHROME KINASE SUBSTRATE 3 [Sesamum calycinum]|uniref:Protein PHYTOCHROME KINASE SUBSTRATE 3 n=1 Tax=Sesamum calycinum TaxID=2727403 RepID=A0AAW2NG84_9LAMI